jgi:hypothetical protein
MGDGLDVRLLPASVSPLVAAEISGAPRRCRVLAAFPTCAYIGLGGHDRVLALLAADALALPIGLQLTARSEEVAWGVVPGDEVVVGGGRVELPRVDVVAARIRRPERVRPAPWPAGGRILDPAARSLLVAEAGVLADLAHQLASDALAGRVVTSGVRGLVGAGGGLTPSGDDVLCGVLLTLGAVDTPPARRASSSVRTSVAASLGTTTSLSAALLVAAGAGYAVPDVVRLVTIAVAGTADRSADVALPELLHRVLAIGHSSGRDLVSGVVGALRALDESHDQTPQEGACRG